MQATVERNQITEYSQLVVDLGVYPGAGAIQFAEQFIFGINRSNAGEVFKQLFNGELHDRTDKRVKRCAHCQYYWRDDSLRNTKKTCSDECHTGKKTIQKRKQRERQALLNPKNVEPKRKLEDEYVDWIEYPYWIEEYSMVKSAWKQEVPYEISTIDYIETKNRIYGEGNRKVLSGDKLV